MRKNDVTLRLTRHGALELARLLGDYQRAVDNVAEGVAAAERAKPNLRTRAALADLRRDSRLCAAFRALIEESA
jgi:hypothetical protein